MTDAILLILLSTLRYAQPDIQRSSKVQIQTSDSAQNTSMLALHNIWIGDKPCDKSVVLR
jgi:hypothetical protein